MPKKSPINRSSSAEGPVELEDTISLSRIVYS
jgi:hypothetical protein